MKNNLFKEKEIPGLTICARPTDNALIQVHVLSSHFTEIFNDRYGPSINHFFETGPCNKCQSDLRSPFLFKNALGFHVE